MVDRQLRSSRINSNQLLVVLALLVCLVASLNFMHHSTTSWPSSASSSSLIPTDDVEKSTKTLMQKLNMAMAESDKKDGEIRELKSNHQKSSAEVEQLKQEIKRLQKELDNAKQRAATEQSRLGIDYEFTIKSAKLNNNISNQNTPIYQTKASSINSFWWPSSKQGGLLEKIHNIQHPSNCSSPDTKIFVWPKGAQHNRGLTAFGHTFFKFLMHGENKSFVSNNIKHK